MANFVRCRVAHSCCILWIGRIIISHPCRAVTLEFRIAENPDKGYPTLAVVGQVYAIGILF